MARYSWSVIYDALTNITDVQNITITRGRQQITDVFRGATAVIEGRNVSALPTIEIGQQIEIVASQGIDDFTMFYGIVADVQITYGFVSAMDTYKISCEDSLAIAGRGLTSDSFSWGSGLTAFGAAEAVLADAFGSSLILNGVDTGALVSAQSAPNTNVLTLLNQLMQTEQGYLSGQNEAVIDWYGRNDYSGQPVIGVFTDGTGVTIEETSKFDTVVFRSMADSFFEQTVVEPKGLASVSSGTGKRVYTVQTFDKDLNQSQSLADYLLATLQVQEQVPSTISVMSEVQTNNVAIQAAKEAGTGRRCGLILRSDGYDVFVEGSTVTATPEQSRFTFNLVSSEALVFFILDSLAFGVLDSNKLGY
jgi:hypothetical protein